MGIAPLMLPSSSEQAAAPRRLVAAAIRTPDPRRIPRSQKSPRRLAPVAAGLAQVQTNEGGGYVVVEFAVASDQELLALLTQIGEVPLPPIFTATGPKAPDLLPRAPTASATRPCSQGAGSVAAPDRGLLTYAAGPGLPLQAGGLKTALSVMSVGNLLPLRSGDPREHVMHSERHHVPAATAGSDCAGRKRRLAGRWSRSATVVPPWRRRPHQRRAGPLPGLGATALFHLSPPDRTAAAPLPGGRCPAHCLSPAAIDALMLVAAFAGRRRVPTPMPKRCASATLGPAMPC